MATIYIDGVKAECMTIEEKNNVLKGTDAPSSAIGKNGQIYLKYGSYEKHYFMDNKIVVVENKNDATDLKLYIVGLTKDSSFLPITDTDLLAYLSDITNGYLKACSTYDTANSTTVTGLLAIGDWGSGMMIGTYIPGWTQYKAGTFYGVIDLTESPVPVSGFPSYQENPFVDPDTIIDRGILDSFAKVNDEWQSLIGTDINNIACEVPTEEIPGKVLFKDGKFYNQDILKVGLYKGEVVDGKILCHGLHAGFLLEEINIGQDIIYYDIRVKISTTSEAFVQCGTCLPNLSAEDLYGIIHEGTNRITYNNQGLANNAHTFFMLIPQGSQHYSLFLGDGHASEEQAVDYFIEEISFTLNDGVTYIRS